MSADNGYIIRKKLEHGLPKFVLQMYFASDDTYPDINKVAEAFVFDALIDAVLAYTRLRERPGFVCEYGLDIQISEITT